MSKFLAISLHIDGSGVVEYNEFHREEVDHVLGEFGRDARPVGKDDFGRSSTERAEFVGDPTAEPMALRKRIIDRFRELGYATDGVL